MFARAPGAMTWENYPAHSAMTVFNELIANYMEGRKSGVGWFSGNMAIGFWNLFQIHFSG